MFTYTKLPPILLKTGLQPMFTYTMLHSLFTYTELHPLFIYAFYILFYWVTSFFNLHCLCPWTTNTKWSVSSILDISPRLVAMDTYNNDVISKICLELNNKCFQFKSILNKFTLKLLHHQSLKPPNLHSGLFSSVVMVLSYLHTKHWNRHRNCLSTKINSLWKKKYETNIVLNFGHFWMSSEGYNGS